MSDFRRTHHDNWQEHKQKFTEDQLLVLTDLLVSPCYYAWRTIKACLQNSLNGIGVVNKLYNWPYTYHVCKRHVYKVLFTVDIYNVEWSSYSHFWHTGSDVRGIYITWLRSRWLFMQPWCMSVPSITRSARQLRGTLVFRQSRIPVHCIVTGHRMLFQEPKNNEV